MRDRAGYLLAGLCLAALWAGYADGQSERYRGYPSDFGVVASASNWEDVTPSDVTNFTYRPRAIYVGGDGDAARHPALTDQRHGHDRHEHHRPPVR